MITCKNCGHTYEGNYCNMCKQPANTERFSWSHMVRMVPYAMFHVDGGLFHTVKEMAVHPGRTIRGYFEGKRVHHFNPFFFVLLLGGIASFLFITAHLKLLNKEIDLDKLVTMNSALAYKYFVFSGIIIIIIASIGDYLFFFGKKYTMPEVIVSNTFQVGQLLFFLILLFPVLLLQKEINTHYGILIRLRPFIQVAIVAYLFFVRYQLYEAKGNYTRMILIAVELVGLYLFYDFVIAGYLIPLLMS